VRADILRLALGERQARFDCLGGCCSRILGSLKEYLAVEPEASQEGWEAFRQGMQGLTSEFENLLDEPLGMAEAHAQRA